jgi:amino acid adenylation domain-containing protein
MMISDASDTTARTRQALVEKYLRQKHALQTNASRKAIPRCAREGALPLSIGQQQIWLVSQLIRDVPVYNERMTLHLPGPLNIAVFERSFNEILRRHEAWRTCFPIEDGLPVQRICAYQPLTFPVIDLRGLPETAREAEALRLATENANKPFDLAHGPLLCPLLVLLSKTDTRFFLTLHHMIFDGFSLYQVLLPQLRALYDAFLAGQSAPLPELPIQYADFAVWQREELQKKTLASHLAYWKQQLAGASSTLNLPSDRPRPLVASYRGGMYPFALSRELTDALKALSQREHVTLFMTMVAAFQSLLHRYSGQDDILIGTTISDRRRPEVQNLLGLFLNTVVLRGNLAGNPSFRDLLRQARKVTLEAQMHQDVPFDVLVQELQPERHAGQHPLFQVMLAFEPPLPSHPSGWTITAMDVKMNISQFDLYLELDERPEGLIGRFEYSSDLFDEATIVRMFGHWQTLLQGIVVHPDRCLSDLPLLTPAERQQMLVEWNATATTSPQDQCLHQLFEAQAARTPDAPALLFASQQMSYRELNEKVQQLAWYLQHQGVGPDVPVGIYVERSLDMLVALLGILKAGGAYVPLDPAYPQERLAYMLQDSQALLLVTQQKLLERLPAQCPPAICLDSEWQTIAASAQQGSQEVLHKISPEHLAYIIYTSGSTGRPKGVQIPHQAAVNLLLHMQQYLEISDQDLFLGITSLSFDTAVAELFLPLITGARLLLETRETLTDGVALLGEITTWHPTMIQATPATWRMLLDAGLSTLQRTRIISTGEALDRELRDRLLALQPAAFWNLYGPTETTIWSTAHRITGQTEPLVIGRPIANTQTYILDAHRLPVPTGVPGELYIGGAGLACGYLHQPELTAEKFVANPFSDDPTSRLYRTGDLVRYLPDGTMEYLGRIDDQVKIRGLRIELGEIEYVLRQLPEIRAAVVVAREEKPGDKRLVAYLTTASEEQQLTVERLVKVLKEQLPDYMLPSAFVRLDALPLTPNGKVDRRALPAPNSTLATSGESFVAPTQLVHYQLQQIWEELLEVRPIGIRDNFFYLGGHSLLAARLLNRIEQSFGKKLSLATLFAGPTIEQLANALQTEEQGSRVPVIPLQVNGSRRPFFYLHGNWNSEAFYCYALARHLGPDQPFYALEPYHFEGLCVPPTIEAMAAAHLEAIRAVQPEGPYVLGGFCNGGLVAYEMARQLQAQGEQVETLLLINPALSLLQHKLVRSLVDCVSGLLRISQEKQLEWFMLLRHIYKHLRHERDAENLKDFNFIDPSIHTLIPTANALRQDNIAIFCWLMTKYRYGSYAGKVIVLRVSNEVGGDKFWQRKAKGGNVELHTIPGTHVSCRTTYVQALAEKLKHCLNRAR